MRGRRSGDYATLTTIMIESEERIAETIAEAKAAARVRAEAEARLRALEEELRRLRGDE